MQQSSRTYPTSAHAKALDKITECLSERGYVFRMNPTLKLWLIGNCFHCLQGTMGHPGDVMKCHLRELLLYFFSSFLAKIYWGELSAQFAIKPSCEVFERSCLNSPIFLSVKFAARRTRVLISVSLRNSPHSLYREVFSSISHRGLTFSYPENKTVQQFSQYGL